MSETPDALKFVHRRLLMDVAFAEVRELLSLLAEVLSTMESEAMFCDGIGFDFVGRGHVMSSDALCSRNNVIYTPALCRHCTICASMPTAMLMPIPDAGARHGKHWIASGCLLWPYRVSQVSSFARRKCSEEKSPRTNASHVCRAHGTG